MFQDIEFQLNERKVLTIRFDIVLCLSAFFCGRGVVAEEPPAPVEASTQSAASSVAKLIPELGDDDFNVREQAQAKILEFGELAANEVRKGCKSKDLEIAIRCLRILELIRLQSLGGLQVHMVGLYESNSGSAIVEVDIPDKPTIIVVTAYESVEWEIKPSARTKIVSVIASGYHEQFVVGVDSPVRKSSYDQRSDDYFYCYKPRGNRYTRAEEIVFRETDAYPQSFQGRYSFEKSPFIIESK